ncbi:MAG: gyrase subunit, partial [Pseudomonadota bacterium]
GVRGMALKGDDEVISLSILRRSGADQDEREAYMRAAPWKSNDNAPALSEERMAEMAEREQFILTVCANGYGKRSSAYEYRRTGRGGQGITNIDNIARNGAVVASFAARDGEQLMLITNQAKMIRLEIGGMRVIGRNTAGVKLFDVADNEHIVSSAKIGETDDEDDGVEGEGIDSAIASVDAAPVEGAVAAPDSED